MLITSKENQTIKEIKKLKEKKYRKDKFIVEGIKMIKEAISENIEIEYLVFADLSLEKEINNIDKYNVLEVTEKILQELSDVVTPQGVLAVVRKKCGNVMLENADYKANYEKKENEIKQETKQIKDDFLDKYNIDYNSDYILALDGLQDPGNMGTIIRTADSANIKQIIVSKNTVDSYSSKVIRSTMGAIFRVNIIEVENLADTLEELKNKGFNIISTSLDTKNSIYDVDYKKSVVVIGNEANGVTKEVQEISNKKVKIPMLGKTESLNASVAAGIMIYEYVRQKLECK